MPEHDSLTAQIAEFLRQQNSAEIVVGVPSYDHVATIPGVVRSVRQGLRECFPGKKAIIVNVDGGSTDGTTVHLAELRDEEGAGLAQVRLAGHELLMPYHGIPGKGEAVRLTLQVARQMGASLCLLLSPDLDVLPSAWIGQLAAPILEQGFDYAGPIYLRHRLDGAIISSIVRPLLQALYGKRIRQPMAGEYALSGALVERCLAQNVWDTDLARTGIDLWITTQALGGPFRACQVLLGRKQQAPAPPRVGLGAALGQVLGGLFEDTGRNAQVWQRVRGSQPVALLGGPVDGAPLGADLDYRKLVESFALGLRNLQDVWSLVLAPATLLDLRRAVAAPVESFALSDQLWCRVLFDFCLGYRARTINRNHLLAAFLPLYLGWLASFVREMRDAGPGEGEDRIAQLCGVCEQQKPYLMSRWRSPDRFNP
jgi:glucosylglycerate synthase